MAKQSYIRTEYEDGSVVLSNIRKKRSSIPVYGVNENYTATKVTTWYDGTPMTPEKADGSVYLQLKSTNEYFRINLPNWGETFLEKNTMAEMRGLSLTDILLLRVGYYKGVGLSGYYKEGDTPGRIEYYISSTSATDDGGSVISVGGIKLEHDFGTIYNVLYFGAKGDDVFDNTDIIVNLKNTLISKPVTNRGTIYFPRGRYKYTDIGRTAYINLKWEGEDMDRTFLISTSGDIAFNQDGQLGDTAARPMVDGCDVKNLTISGHASTKIIWKQNSLSRGEFSKINLMNANPIDGIGLETSNMLGKYDSIFCSTNKNIMNSVPKLGLKLVEGFRLGVSLGRSTNNKFTSCYWEGTAQGIYIKEGDNNCFIGGSPEANTEFSLLIDENNKGNSFYGVGFESNLAPQDIIDNGWFTRYVGCYSSNKFVFGEKSRGVTWTSGTLQSVELKIVDTARAWWPRIEQSHWNHDSARIPAATFIDQGAIRPTFINVYNRANGVFQKGYDEVNQENYYGTRYLNLASATGDTRAGNFQEYIESNFNGNQTITFKVSTEYSIGVTKTIRKNTSTGVTTITPEAGVTFNSITAPVTLNSLNEQVVFFCVGLNSWRYYKIPANNATTSAYGVVRQSSLVNPVTVADLTKIITADATDLPTALALLNELKAKYNLAVDLENKNKEVLNTLLTVEKTSGQMASS